MPADTMPAPVEGAGTEDSELTVDVEALRDTIDLEFFKAVDVDVLRNTITAGPYGHSLLMAAASYGHVDSCEEILKKCPALLYKRNNFGATALHQAATNGKVNCLKLLLSRIESQDGNEDNLLTAVTSNQNTALHSAVQAGELECAKLLIEADSSLLSMANNKGDTAMHIAVTMHNPDIVKLLCESDSNLPYPANNAGQTPLWLAVQEAHAGDSRAVEIRKLLIEKQPDECTRRRDAQKWTILHQAVYKGDLDTVQDIFRFCPACIGLVDNEGQNFLHLAAKLKHVDIMRYAMGTDTLPEGVVNGKDKDGNTPLHIAVLAGQLSTASPLLYDSRVSKVIKNKKGKTALDMIHFEYDKVRAGVYGLPHTLTEKELKERSDFDLVVAAIIATVSFAAGITVPGGYINDGPRKGTAILAKKLSFKAFAVANTISLLLALYAVFSNFCAKHFVGVGQTNVMFQLKVATNCSLGAMFGMVIAFVAGSYAVLSVTNEFAIFVSVLCCCFFLFASRALWRMSGQRGSGSCFFC